MLKKVALISGSTRGIGKKIAEKLASQNYEVIITGKNKTDLETIQKKIMNKGLSAYALELDLRNQDNIRSVVENIRTRYGFIDVLVNNASAMWWMPIEETNAKKYDLVNGVNARGTYLLSRECLPYIRSGGHIITHSPPINSKYMNMYLENDLIKYKVGYMVSKLGMSIVGAGLSQELKDRKIASNCIWPKTAIHTAAMENNPLIPKELNHKQLWRKPDIVADMIGHLVEEPSDFTGKFLIDEEYLRSKGYTDFKQYRCDPNIEPPDLFQLSGQMAKMIK